MESWFSHQKTLLKRLTNSKQESMMGTKESKDTKTVLPEKAVLEFMEIYNRTCKQKIAFKQAQTEALNFLKLFHLIGNR